MSDGPYRSLPMSRGWKRLAEFAENMNFDRADTSAAASHALKATWGNEVPAAILKALREVFFEREPGLFADARVAKVEVLATDTAGYGLGRLLAAHASRVLAEGLTGEAGLVEATKRALDSYMARATRQIEEHYCRKASSRLTAQVRARISDAVSTADIAMLARQCAGLEPRVRRGGGIRKHADIDAGVAL